MVAGGSRKRVGDMAQNPGWIVTDGDEPRRQQKKVCHASRFFVVLGVVLLGIILVPVLLVGGIWFVLALTTADYVADVSHQQAPAHLDSELSVEARAKQLKFKAEQIDSEVKANSEKLVKLDVDIKNREQEVAALKQDQTQRKAEISTLANRLQNEREKVPASDKKKLENQLEAAVSAYEAKDAKIKNLEAVIAAKRETLEAAQQKTGEMREQRAQLKTAIQNLENRLAVVDLKTQPALSDSQSEELKAIIKDIENKLAEQELQAENYRKFGVAPDKDNQSAPDALDRAKKILDPDDEKKPAPMPK
jgi:chromosome segregation ATPase